MFSLKNIAHQDMNMKWHSLWTQGDMRRDGKMAKQVENPREIPTSEGNESHKNPRGLA